MADRMVLVGMMGSGKTTVGRELAGRLGWAFLDSDAMVEAVDRLDGGRAVRRPGRGRRSGPRSPGSWPRRWRSPTPAVVSAAGGAVLDPANRALLAGQAMVVWLRADPATLAARVGNGRGPAPVGRRSGRPAWPSSTPSAARSTRRWPTWWSTSTASTPRRVADRILSLTAFERTRP